MSTIEQQVAMQRQKRIDDTARAREINKTFMNANQGLGPREIEHLKRGILSSAKLQLRNYFAQYYPEQLLMSNHEAIIYRNEEGPFELYEIKERYEPRDLTPLVQTLATYAVGLALLEQRYPPQKEHWMTHLTEDTLTHKIRSYFDNKDEERYGAKRRRNSRRFNYYNHEDDLSIIYTTTPDGKGEVNVMQFGIDNWHRAVFQATHDKPLTPSIDGMPFMMLDLSPEKRRSSVISAQFERNKKIFSVREYTPGPWVNTLHHSYEKRIASLRQEEQEAKLLAMTIADEKEAAMQTMPSAK